MTLARVAADPLLDRRAGAQAGWRRHLAAWALVVAAMLVLFRRDVADLVRIWWTSTTFGHCLFIGPVIAWLIWQRRGELARLRPVAWAPGLALVAAGGIGWLVGDAGSAAIARQFGLLLMLQGSVVTLFGPRVARGLSFPLGYAVFLIPFGEGLEPPLQQVTVAMLLPLLHAGGLAASVDGVVIHAGRYWFEVAEACSGAKFVIAMVAFGVLVANLCFTSWRRRALFLLVSVVVPVIANGLRAWATIYAANLTSVEAATGFDHIVYGWLFFGLVMAAVLAIGWRWFDRAPDAPAFDPARLQAPVRYRLALGPAALLVLAVAWAFPAWSDTLASRPQPVPARIDLPDVPGWRRADLSRRAPWTPSYPGADHRLFGRYVDARGDAVDMAVALFGQQREEHELVAFGTGVLREEDRWVRIADEAPLLGGSVMRITAPGPVERLVATWYRVGNAETASPARVKLLTTRARLFGGAQRAVALHLSAEVVAGHDARAAIARFRRALPALYVERR